MQPPVDYDGKRRFAARAPQGTTITVSNPTPFIPDPTAYMTAAPVPAPNDNSTAVRTIIQYFFLIMALLVASILVFRRVFYLRRRDRFRHQLYNYPAQEAATPPSFPRTTGLPRVNLQAYPLPLLDNYFIALPLPTAHTTTRTRARDIDLQGRRFTSAGAETDHDGLLRDKDVLPKYESLGGPPKYAELEQQQAEDVAPAISVPVIPHPPPPAAQSPRNGSGGIASAEAETPSGQTPLSRDDAIPGYSVSVPSSPRP